MKSFCYPLLGLALTVTAQPPPVLQVSIQRGEAQVHVRIQPELSPVVLLSSPQPQGPWRPWQWRPVTSRQEFGQDTTLGPTCFYRSQWLETQRVARPEMITIWRQTNGGVQVSAALAFREDDTQVGPIWVFRCDPTGLGICLGATESRHNSYTDFPPSGRWHYRMMAQDGPYLSLMSEPSVEVVR